MNSTTFFEDSDYYTGPELTDAMVGEAEVRVGFALPRSYLDLLGVRNGGTPRRKCFPTGFATSWAPDHFEIDAILGVGGAWGIDTGEHLSSPEMIEEWGYPRIGVVICSMPSGGHDTVMLDYSRPGLEPAVAYVDEDRIPRVIATSFSEFIDNLVTCERFH